MHIASYLKAHVKVEVQILDGFFESDEYIINAVRDSDYVGLSGTTPQVPHLVRLAQAIKHNYPGIKTVAGGFGISLEPNKAVQIPYFDHIVLGEGEQSMLDIIRGGQPRIVSTPVEADVDLLPFADRDAVDLERYIQIAKRDEGRRVTSVMTERGCAFGCTFCAEGIYGTIWRKYDTSNPDGITPERPMPRVRMRNPKLVVREMIEVRDKFDIEFFKTSDAETNPTRQHFIGICKEMVEQKLNIPWGCNMRADKLDDEMCEWAVKANCEEFWIGLESGSDIIHQHIKKGTTVDMIRRAFSLSKKYGITRRMYGFIGTSPETLDTIRQTESLIEECDPDVFGLCILCPYPGTMYYDPIKHKDVDWEKIDEYSNHLWSTPNLSNDDLRAEQARMIKKFEKKLAVIFRKKWTNGIISFPEMAKPLDSLQQHPSRF